MAADARKRQKKQERRAKRRKEKKHQLVRSQAAGLAGRLAEAAGRSVLHCWITESLWTEGLGLVILSRELPGGRVAVANILVDRYCLGIKDAFAEIIGRSEYAAKYVQGIGKPLRARDVLPADARRLLDGAVAYAWGLGFAPHPDYDDALILFGPINPADGTATFEFGKDGQPLFVAGPNDTPARCRQVLATLTNTCGPGGFHYVIPMAAPAARWGGVDEGGELALAGWDDDEEDFDETDEEDEDDA